MVLPRSKLLSSTCLFLSFFASPASAKYDYLRCCNSASSLNAFHPAPTQAVICGQEYNASLLAAPTLYVPYTFCKANCDGIGLSSLTKPSSWAAPIIQFILPSVIFSMSIPRRKMFSFYTLREGNAVLARSTLRKFLYYSGVSALFQICVLILDNIIWIAVILTFAGPMMLSGLYEAVLDWQILGTLLSKPGKHLSEREKIELLATVVSGNLLRASGRGNEPNEGNPQHEIVDKLATSPRHECKKACLLGLLTSQVGFGAIAGAPVLFYLGAFVYTILDLSNKPSDEDAAISLAFGAEWMIIVHVAIIGSCLLATNNPSTASVLVGLSPFQSFPGIRRPRTTETLANTGQRGFWGRFGDGQLLRIGFLKDIYNNRYQPVTMWSRGQNKYEWVQNSRAWREAPQVDLAYTLSLRKRLTVGYWKGFFLVLLPTYALINLPPTAGALVAWKTPPVGWGCRSLSFVCYAGGQFFVVQLFMLTQFLSFSGKAANTFRWNLLALQYYMRLLLLVLVWVLYGLFCVVTLFVVLGGTLMQVIGVYRNCFCYVNAPEWYSLDSARVQVANDTQEQRDSNHNWIAFGGVATLFMGICCFGGWWYQQVIRERYKRILHELWNDESIA